MCRNRKQIYNLIRQLRGSDCRTRYDVEEGERGLGEGGKEEGRHTPENGGLMAS